MIERIKSTAEAIKLYPEAGIHLAKRALAMAITRWDKLDTQAANAINTPEDES